MNKFNRYIEEHLEKGYTEKQLKAWLVQNGYSKGYVDTKFRSYYFRNANYILASLILIVAMLFFIKPIVTGAVIFDENEYNLVKEKTYEDLPKGNLIEKVAYDNQDILAFKINKKLGSHYCVEWSIYDLYDTSLERICNGDEKCCRFFELNVNSPNPDEVLYINQGKYGAGERNKVNARVLYFSFGEKTEIWQSDVNTLDGNFESTE